MAKYSVTGKVVGSKYLGEVEADSLEQAFEKAEKLDFYVSLCHQCDDQCEDAEVTEWNVSLIKD